MQSSKSKTNNMQPLADDYFSILSCRKYFLQNETNPVSENVIFNSNAHCNLPISLMSKASIVKSRQANQWHHLPAYSCTKRGIARGGGGVQNTCLVGCRLPPLDGSMAVCLVLTIELYANVFSKNVANCVKQHNIIPIPNDAFAEGGARNGSWLLAVTNDK